MGDKYHLLKSLFIVAVISGTVAKPVSAPEFGEIDQTLDVIRDCMAQSPAP
jgi:hypothetical protein